MADEKPPKKRRATYDDLVAVPGFLVAEILGGELVTSPRPGPRHAQAESSLAGLIGNPFQRSIGGPGGWWILVEPELHLLGQEVLVPDLAGWRIERLPALPEEAAFTLAPDWICEVLSPASVVRDRTQKLPIYHEAGVSHAWLVDPDPRTLEVLRREDDGWKTVATHAGDVSVAAEPFEDVSLDLALVWRTRAEPALTSPRR